MQYYYTSNIIGHLSKLIYLTRAQTNKHTGKIHTHTQTERERERERERENMTQTWTGFEVPVLFWAGANR